MKNIYLLLVLAGFILSAGGCGALVVGAVGGAGTAYWLSNKLTDEIPASSERSVDATKNALASLNMPLIKETRTEDVVQIISEYPDDHTVWIDIRPLTADTTKMEIRVGLTGDKSASNKILERIKGNLRE